MGFQAARWSTQPTRKEYGYEEQGVKEQQCPSHGEVDEQADYAVAPSDWQHQHKAFTSSNGEEKPGACIVLTSPLFSPPGEQQASGHHDDRCQSRSEKAPSTTCFLGLNLLHSQLAFDVVSSATPGGAGCGSPQSCSNFHDRSTAHCSGINAGV